MTEGDPAADEAGERSPEVDDSATGDGSRQGRTRTPDAESMADALARRLLDRGYTLAVAESCTAGLVSARITDRPGASAYLLGGVVAYANAAKTEMLGVPPSIIAEHGAVSEETARAMVAGVRARLGADAAIAVTGIAGPTGGSPQKPVGTVWIATAVGDDVVARHYLFPGDRAEIRARAAEAALAQLWRHLAI